MMKIFSVLIFFLVYSKQSGIGVHLEVCERSKEFLNVKYRNIVDSYHEYFQMGIAFPDWGYILGYNKEAEYAHSETLIKKLVDYSMEVRDETEKKKLIAFILGMGCHKIADSLWHGDKGDNMSLIAIQSMIDYDINCVRGMGCFTKSHDYADNGGDIILYRYTNIDYLDLGWKYPNKIIEIIYNETVSEWSIRWRLFIYKLQLFMMEMGFGNIAFPFFRNQFLIEKINDWISGGIDHMSAVTLQYWNIMFKDSIKKEIDYTYNSYFDGSNTYIGYSILYEDIDGDNITDLIIGAPGYGLLSGRVYIKFGPINVNCNDIHADIIIDGNKLSRFGHSLISVDIDLDGNKELIIGAPMYENINITYFSFNYSLFLGNNKGAIFIYSIKKGGATLRKIIQPDKNDTYFGWNLNIADVNCDGNNDVIIGSPYSSENGDILVGRVSIIYSRSNISRVNIDINLIGDSKLSHFGFSIAIWSDYLIISAPLYNRTGRVLGYKNLKLVFVINGHVQNSNTGRSILLINESSNLNLLISTFRYHMGIVVMIDITYLRGNYSLHDINILNTYYGSHANSFFGYKIGLTNSGFWISEPFFNNGIFGLLNGAVYVWNLQHTKYYKRIVGDRNKSLLGINALYMRLYNTSLIFIMEKHLSSRYRICPHNI